jgi:hypothetical protein
LRVSPIGQKSKLTWLRVSPKEHSLYI